MYVMSFKSDVYVVNVTCAATTIEFKVQNADILVNVTLQKSGMQIFQ
jgi:hypothetical protein